ncbi:hypothetical protein [Paenibacillus cymbidii]|uniref:hypothetical protein n=1 Tax=Paenibacillus cymbidii TaxID=1639034 RepID=UPI00107FED84|nr:hypothetical protein [Paenibacillus cymbidii]
MISLAILVRVAIFGEIGHEMWLILKGAAVWEWLEWQELLGLVKLLELLELLESLKSQELLW